MNQNRLTVLTRSLTDYPSRRHVLRGLVGAGLGLGAARLPEAAARKKRKKRKKTPKFNAFGCVNVGDFCKSADQCCSGICEGQLGNKKCRAHGTGGCPPGVQDTSCNAAGGTNIPCTTATGNPNGLCGTTTGNAGYCLDSGGCYPCTKDVECQSQCGPQAACIRCDDCEETGGTSCARPDNGGCQSVVAAAGKPATTRA
ncbi:MAG: hypothetical protein ACRDJC_17750 [Thermomicrobiales bacterium]